MDKFDAERYDRLIYDGARDLAFKNRKNIRQMHADLLKLGAPMNAINDVIEAMQSPDYYEENYRGKKCDEGVIEALKDCLRPLHGF